MLAYYGYFSYFQFSHMVNVVMEHQVGNDV